MKFQSKGLFRSGFTLVEIMAVIAIVGIMSGIAIPNFISWLPDYKLKSSTRDIVSCMQSARLRAVKENANALINFDVGNDQYKAWVDNGSSGGAGNWVPDLKPSDDEVVFNQKTLPAGIVFYKNTSFNSNIFGFNSRGIPVVIAGFPNGTVFVKNNKPNYRKIVVNRVGSIRVEKSSDGIRWVR